jgi:hypothetical protein
MTFEEWWESPERRAPCESTQMDGGVARKSAAIVVIFVALGMARGFPPDEPRLSYAPGGIIKLELRRHLPGRMRLCGENEKFKFCSPWIGPKSHTVDITLDIPSNTPDGDYKLMYEDEKGSVDLKHAFTVENGQAETDNGTVKILAARAWNAALNASLELLLRCCCSHPRSEHEDEGKCTHAGCDCVNLCDCWITVSEMKEYEQPGYIAQRFVPLRAK